MDCRQCDDVTNERCDWGNYFSVIDSKPDDFGYKGPWTSAEWLDSPHDLDTLRMSPGCSVEVAREANGGGQTYVFNSDVRVCGNNVGCDSIRSLRVFPSSGAHEVIDPAGNAIYLFEDKSRGALCDALDYDGGAVPPEQADHCCGGEAYCCGTEACGAGSDECGTRFRCGRAHDTHEVIGPAGNACCGQPAIEMQCPQGLVIVSGWIKGECQSKQCDVGATKCSTPSCDTGHDEHWHSSMICSNPNTVIEAHDSSKCREHQPDSHDPDCCGNADATWCADGFTKVHRAGGGCDQEKDNGTFKNYVCLPPDGDGGGVEALRCYETALAQVEAGQYCLFLGTSLVSHAPDEFCCAVAEGLPVESPTDCRADVDLSGTCTSVETATGRSSSGDDRPYTCVVTQAGCVATFQCDDGSWEQKWNAEEGQLYWVDARDSSRVTWSKPTGYDAVSKAAVTGARLQWVYGWDGTGYIAGSEIIMSHGHTCQMDWPAPLSRESALHAESGATVAGWSDTKVTRVPSLGSRGYVHGPWGRDVTRASISIPVPAGAFQCVVSWRSWSIDSRDGETDRVLVDGTVIAEAAMQYQMCPSGSSAAIGGDDSKCRDVANDCCANAPPTGSEAAVCADGYTPSVQPSSYDDCPNYTCYPPGTAASGSHDSSKCREHQPDSHDPDCCGNADATWCADEYTKVHQAGGGCGQEKDNGIFKNYVCLPPDGGGALADGWQSAPSDFPQAWGAAHDTCYLDVSAPAACASPSMTLTFTSDIDQALDDEAWAFSDVTIVAWSWSLSPPPPPVRVDGSLRFSSKAGSVTRAEVARALAGTLGAGAVTVDDVSLKTTLVVADALICGLSGNAARLMLAATEASMATVLGFPPDRGAGADEARVSVVCASAGSGRRLATSAESHVVRIRGGEQQSRRLAEVPFEMTFTVEVEDDTAIQQVVSTINTAGSRLVGDDFAESVASTARDEGFKAALGLSAVRDEILPMAAQLTDALSLDESQIDFETEISYSVAVAPEDSGSTAAEMADPVAMTTMLTAIDPTLEPTVTHSSGQESKPVVLQPATADNNDQSFDLMVVILLAVVILLVIIVLVVIVVFLRRSKRAAAPSIPLEFYSERPAPTQASIPTVMGTVVPLDSPEPQGRHIAQSHVMQPQGPPPDSPGVIRGLVDPDPWAPNVPNAPVVGQSATPNAPVVGQSSCSRCGSGMSVGARFCNSCGAPHSAQPKFCTNCGSSVLPGASFCAGCGTSTVSKGQQAP
jgi:hypothetical protein